MHEPCAQRRKRPGDVDLEAAFSRVYEDLRRLAHHLRASPAGDGPRTISLVHEAYLKLARSPSARWEDDVHLIRVAARAMRQLLADSAAARRAAKRGGSARPVTLRPSIAGREVDLDALLDVDRALDRLADVHPRAAEVLELRFFIGLSVDETAAVLGISPPTVKRDWRLARAWLGKEVRPG